MKTNPCHTCKPNECCENMHQNNEEHKMKKQKQINFNNKTTINTHSTMSQNITKEKVRFRN